MRCINCGVDTHRMRRHLTSSLPGLLITILARWLSIEVPMDAVICNSCFELLHSERAGDVRLFGHTMLCINCGHSVRNVQRHTVERNDLMIQNLPSSNPAFHQDLNYATHRCWIRHQRQTNQDQNRFNAPSSGPAPTPEPEPLFEQIPNTVPEPEIYLPNYKRAANTSTHCVFNGCAYEQQLHVMPSYIKKMLLEKHNLYTPRNTRVCETHITLGDWHLLPKNNNLSNNFTATQIEDAMGIAKSEKSSFNFEKVAEMENVLINKYHILLEDGPNAQQIIQRVAQYMHVPNHLSSFVRDNNLNRQRTIFSRVVGNLPQLQNFPIFEYNQLILLALGPYQVKQARSYYGEHIRGNGIYKVEVCPDLERIGHLGGSRPQLLRGRIKSRHISQRMYYV